MDIPLVDLRPQWGAIREDVERGLQRVLSSGSFAMGEEVARLEREFASYCGTGHAIGVNSGTSALHLALIACEVGSGDEVVTTSNTFIATAEAISYVGARPVFVDIDPVSHSLDVNQLEEAIGDRTKAIIPVHLYGQPADLDPVLDVACQRGLWVIEDACQAHGAEYKGRKVGSLGHLGCFSFYPTKNLGAYGEGGMVVTSSDELARRIKRLRSHGETARYRHDEVGYNYRMDEMQAAILRVKLEHLDEWNARRRANAVRYRELLEDCPGVETPVELENRRHVYHLFVIRTSH